MSTTIQQQVFLKAADIVRERGWERLYWQNTQGGVCMGQAMSMACCALTNDPGDQLNNLGLTRPTTKEGKKLDDAVLPHIMDAIENNPKMGSKEEAISYLEDKAKSY